MGRGPRAVHGGSRGPWSIHLSPLLRAKWKNCSEAAVVSVDRVYYLLFSKNKNNKRQIKLTKIRIHRRRRNIIDEGSTDGDVNKLQNRFNILGDQISFRFLRRTTDLSLRQLSATYFKLQLVLFSAYLETVKANVLRNAQQPLVYATQILPCQGWVHEHLLEVGTWTPSGGDATYSMSIKFLKRHFW